MEPFLQTKHNASGSVLVYILIAIMLFAALSYTVADMMRGGNTDMVSDQKASLLADEILTYAEKIKQAAQTLRISKGCDAADISFEDTALAGYAHTPAVSDSCKIFNAAGGGVTYIPPTTTFGTDTAWVFTGEASVIGLGTDCTSGDTCTELLMVLQGVTLPVCNALNKKLRVTTPSGAPPIQDDPVTFSAFTGSFTWAGDLGDGTHDDVLKTKPAACTQVSTLDSYVFYTSLIPR